MRLNKKQRKIYKQRSKKYGDAIFNHENVALMWTGILQCHYGIKLPSTLPNHVVALMMSAIKVSRAAEGEYSEDDYIDASIYLYLAEKGQKK